MVIPPLRDRIRRYTYNAGFLLKLNKNSSKQIMGAELEFIEELFKNINGLCGEYISDINNRERAMNLITNFGNAKKRHVMINLTKSSPISKDKSKKNNFKLKDIIEAIYWKKYIEKSLKNKV